MNEYLKGTVLERVPSKIFMGLAADDPVYKSYRPALVSGSKEESLVSVLTTFCNVACAVKFDTNAGVLQAGFAIWEPPHGRFKMFQYPWQSYVKVGAVLRHCTYSVVALHGCLRSAIQVSLGSSCFRGSCSLM